MVLFSSNTKRLLMYCDVTIMTIIPQSLPHSSSPGEARQSLRLELRKWLRKRTM
jgi:hypothetical protein